MYIFRVGMGVFNELRRLIGNISLSIGAMGSFPDFTAMSRRQSIEFCILVYRSRLPLHLICIPEQGRQECEH